MAVASININTDTATKEKAQAIFDDLGLDVSTAINIFLKQVIYREGIPFEITKQNTKSDNARMVDDLERIRQKRLSAKGSLKGKIWMSDDFDAPIEEMKEYME